MKNFMSKTEWIILITIAVISAVGMSLVVAIYSNMPTVAQVVAILIIWITMGSAFLPLLIMKKDLKRPDPKGFRT